MEQIEKVRLPETNGNSVLDNEALLQKFGNRLAQLVAPGALPAVVQGAIAQAIEELRDTANAGATPLSGFPRARNISLVGGRNLELVFVHDCRLDTFLGHQRLDWHFGPASEMMHMKPPVALKVSKLCSKFCRKGCQLVCFVWQA